MIFPVTADELEITFPCFVLHMLFLIQVHMLLKALFLVCRILNEMENYRACSVCDDANDPCCHSESVTKFPKRACEQGRKKMCRHIFDIRNQKQNIRYIEPEQVSGYTVWL